MIVIETRIKKYGNQRKSYINLIAKGWFRKGIHNLLRELTLTVCDAYCYFENRYITTQW